MSYQGFLETVGFVSLGVVLGAIITATRTVVLSEDGFAGLIVTLDALMQARNEVMAVALAIFAVAMFASLALELRGGE